MNFIKNPSFTFLIRFLPAIILWYSFYHFIYKLDHLIDPDFNFLLLFSETLSLQSNFLLKIIGLNAITELHGDMVVAKILDFPYTHGVWIGEPCNGIKVFGLFAIFISIFNGKAIHKIWFIPTGIILLHLLNVIRVSALTYIAAVQPNWLNFNHNITFQLMMYSVMFFLWYTWITKFSFSTNAKKENEET